MPRPNAGNKPLVGLITLLDYDLNNLKEAQASARAVVEELDKLKKYIIDGMKEEIW